MIQNAGPYSTQSKESISQKNIPKMVKKLPEQENNISPTTHKTKDRHGPIGLDYQPTMNNTQMMKDGNLLDLGYVLAKNVNPMPMPSWKHNQKSPSSSSEVNITKSAIDYLNPIMAPAREINTINTILTNALHYYPLLLFIRGTRSSNWDLHLAVISEMLPWFFAYNHTNYSRSV